MLQVLLSVCMCVWMLYKCIRERCFITAGLVIMLGVLSVLSIAVDNLKNISIFVKFATPAILVLGIIVAYTYESEKNEGE